MKIQPAKSEGVPAPVKPKAAPVKAPEAPAETESSHSVREARLRDILAQEPAVRPDQVERGKVLARDPNYPSGDLLAKLAEMLVDGKTA
jgi:hypothetical protein